MADADVVAAAEAFPVVAAEGALYIRMAKLVSIVDVGATVIVEVLTSAFDAIMEPSTLNLLKLGWRSIPSAAWTILVCAGRRWRRTRLILGLCDRGRKQHSSSECEGGEDSSGVQGGIQMLTFFRAIFRIMFSHAS